MTLPGLPEGLRVRSRSIRPTLTPGTGFILSTLIIAVPGSVIPLVRALLRNSSKEMTDRDWVENTSRSGASVCQYCSTAMRINPRIWRDADRCVWDRLGGRDALKLGICASRFMSSTSRFTSSVQPPFTVDVLRAQCEYWDSGKRFQLGVVESDMSGQLISAVVLVDIRPVPWTLQWVLWMLDPKGDEDTRRHRSSFYFGRLADMTDERLRDMVESVVGMSVDPWETCQARRIFT